MGQPGLLVLLEVELLQWVELAAASGHDVTVSGDGVGHVEVVNVFNEGGSVDAGVAVWLVSMFLESRAFNDVVLDEMWSQLGKSGSQFIDGVIWERSAKLLRKSSQDHPVVLRETWG